MRLLVDAQLPPTLARWFGEHGIAATAVRELGQRDSAVTMQLKMSSALTPTLSPGAPPGRGSLLWAHWIQSPFSGCRMTDEMFSLSPGAPRGRGLG
jgi:hypothetical protein